MNAAFESAQKFLDTLEKLKDLPERPWGQIAKEQNDTDTFAYLSECQWIAKCVVKTNGEVPNSDYVRRAFDVLCGFVEHMGNFRLGQGAQEYHNHAQTFRKQARELCHEVGAWAAMVDSQDSSGANAAARTQELMKSAAEHERRAAKAADAAQTAAAKTGVAVFTGQFEDDASLYKWRAFWWLVVTAGFLGATLYLSWDLIQLEWAVDWTDWSWIPRFLGRLFILSLLTYATSWSGRMSLSNHHASAVNRHRSNSSRTIEAFRDSATNPAIKDAVVLEAAKAVFENVPTGYLDKPNDVPSGTTKTIELLRTLGPDP